MEKALSSLLLMLGGFVAATTLLALVYPSITTTGNAIAADRAGVTVQSREAIAIVNAMSELDSQGTWQDTDADTHFDLYVWVKNTGAVTIPKPSAIDIFVHTAGIGERIPHANDTAGYPRFTAEVEGGGTWEAGGTLKITVHYGSALTPGDHTIEVTTPRGARHLQRFEL